jgi:hypothetical protein
MRIQLVLINKYGEFVGQKADMSIENYMQLLDMVKSFYLTGGFELSCEDGSFVVFPPDVVKDSILKVVKLSEEESDDVDKDIDEQLD